MRYSELRDLTRLKKISEIPTHAGAKSAVEFVEGPTFGRGIRDMFGTIDCAYTNPLHRMRFAVCIDCLHLDRPNMMCKVGRMPR